MAAPTAGAMTTGVLVGYVRASRGQTLEEELRTLADANCARVFSDAVVGRTASRPGLQACLASLQPGDILVVPTLSGLAHSVHDLIRHVTELAARGAGLRSLDGAVNTTGPKGRTVLEVFMALEQFVRDAYFAAARDGRAAAGGATENRRGRPPRVTPDQVSQARQMLRDPQETVASVARRLGVGRSTLYRYLPELTSRPLSDRAMVER